VQEAIGLDNGKYLGGNPIAHLCVEKLTHLRGCDLHITHVRTTGDETGLRWLRVHLTSDASFATKNLLAS